MSWRILNGSKFKSFRLFSNRAKDLFQKVFMIFNGRGYEDFFLVVLTLLPTLLPMLLPTLTSLTRMLRNILQKSIKTPNWSREIVQDHFVQLGSIRSGTWARMKTFILLFVLTAVSQLKPLSCLYRPGIEPNIAKIIKVT